MSWWEFGNGCNGCNGCNGYAFCGMCLSCGTGRKARPKYKIIKK